MPVYKVIYFLGSLGCLTVASFSILWFFSSTSLASGFCNNEFSLFHEYFRCRQPYIAGILCILFFVLSLILIKLGLNIKINNFLATISALVFLVNFRFGDLLKSAQVSDLIFWASIVPMLLCGSIYYYFRYKK